MKVLVTGASYGIGRGIATVLAKTGHDVGLIARSEDRLAFLQRELASSESQVRYAACDLRDYKATQHALTKLYEQLEGVDALINNAGVVIRKSIWDLSEEEWYQTIDTNVHSLFHTTKTVLPWLKEQKRGHIINVSSISGRLPLENGSAYAASKYAVTGFSESLFLEVRAHGIKVTTIFPGSVDTESHRGNLEGQEDQNENAWKVTPEEVGEACRSVLETSATNVIHRLEIRPLGKP